MPNMGELNKNRLFGLAKRGSERGIQQFIGIGVDFNNDLVEYVSKNQRGQILLRTLLQGV